MKGFVERAIWPELPTLRQFRCPASGGYSRRASNSNPSVVNTAEVMLLLRLNPETYNIELGKGAEFIEGELAQYQQSKEDSYRRRLRYYVFGIKGLLAGGRTETSNSIRMATEHILSLQNSDGGWTHGANSPKSTISATCFAIEALQLVQGADKRIGDALLRASNWIIQMQNPDGIWTMSASQRSAPALATAMCLALVTPQMEDVAKRWQARGFLRRVRRLTGKQPFVTELTDNTNWAHFVPLWLGRCGTLLGDLAICQNAMGTIATLETKKRVTDRAELLLCDHVCNRLQTLADINYLWSPYHFVSEAKTLRVALHHTITWAKISWLIAKVYFHSPH